MVSRGVDAGPVNRILEGLGSIDRRIVAAAVERVRLVPGDVVFAAGKTISHVYFPREGVVSLFAATQEGTSVGAGVIGSDGMLGLALSTGRSRSRLSATSQGHGSGDRMPAAIFVGILAKSAGLRGALLVYGSEQSEQMAQNAACIAFHSAERRLARWMLDVTASSRADRIVSTQADTAIALGVLRPAVSRAASALQRRGLIRYLRGDVCILDRAGLARIACDCSAPPRLRRPVATRRGPAKKAPTST